MLCPFYILHITNYIYAWLKWNELDMFVCCGLYVGTDTKEFAWGKREKKNEERPINQDPYSNHNNNNHR